MAQKVSYPFQIVKHVTKEKHDSPTTYKVILKASAALNVKGKVELESEANDLFTLFPLNEQLQVAFTQPQTTF